jgi:hypothetical protein
MGDLSQKEGKAAQKMSEKGDKLNDLVKKMDQYRVELKLNDAKDQEFRKKVDRSHHELNSKIVSI